MTVQESDRLRERLYHKAQLERRLMFCETKEEENYVKNEIDKISPRDTGIVSDCNSVGVAVPRELGQAGGILEQTDVQFCRQVLVDIADVNAELDPIEQIGYTISYHPRIGQTCILLYRTRTKGHDRWGQWHTGDSKSAFLEIIRGYEP